MSDFMDLEAHEAVFGREIKVESVPEVNDALRVGNPTAIPSFRSDMNNITEEDRVRFGLMRSKWYNGRPRKAPVRRTNRRRTYKRRSGYKRPYKRYASRYRRYNAPRRYMRAGRRRVYGRRRYRR